LPSGFARCNVGQKIEISGQGPTLLRGWKGQLTEQVGIAIFSEFQMAQILN
jgi:hypothetical protein